MIMCKMRMRKWITMVMVEITKKKLMVRTTKKLMGMVTKNKKRIMTYKMFTMKLDQMENNFTSSQRWHSCNEFTSTMVNLIMGPSFQSQMKQVSQFGSTISSREICGHKLSKLIPGRLWIILFQITNWFQLLDFGQRLVATKRGRTA